LALTALAIKLDSRGPVLFMQPRIGYNNAVFMMFKFRSMYDHAADRMARQQTTRDDPRVGRFIRRYSIDELPQLLNVIRGEMSVVGPRPHAPGTNVEGLLLEHVTAGYPLRHRVLPGITGWAQINGSRGMLSSREQIRQRVSLDLEYIDRWSLLLDLKIIWLTAVREIWSRHAY
jgi:lipopolysaccharide/colanic/teichoic acid biosynthesis glycosyltransferase